MADAVRFGSMAALSLALCCSRTPPERAQASPSTASAAASAAPVGTKCLPAQACLEWHGCVRIAPAAGRAWTVTQSERADLKGQPATYSPKNVCSDGSSCPAAVMDPTFMQCPPHTIPPVVMRPNFECIETGGRCRSKMLPPPPAPPPPPPSGSALIKQREGALRGCYPKSVTGTVVLTWRVGQDGRAVRIQVFPMQPALRDPQAEACLRTIVERTAFLPKHAAAYQYRLRL